MAPERFHSVSLLEDKCRGCTNCIKRCPTEAIRVREGKARINAERCIDCGECIRTCDNHAKVAVTDSIERLRDFRATIALPAPSLYGQFDQRVAGDVRRIYRDVMGALLALGFDAVYDVAYAADIASFITRTHIESGATEKPCISSACPAVVRLVQVRFPSLISHLLPVDPPIQIAGKLAKRIYASRSGIDTRDIGAFFITPCAAKMRWVREHINPGGETYVDGAISVAGIYGDLLKNMGAGESGPSSLSDTASGLGVGWGASGGENRAVGLENYLVVDGIHNVIAVFEEIEMGRLASVNFIEAQACTGGCVGGPLMVKNPFVGRVNIRRLAVGMREASPFNEQEESHIMGLYRAGFFETREDLQPVAAFKLDEDMSKAIAKMGQLEKVLEDLPGLDCGSCGSPHCRALAEDIVQGLAVETDCVFKLREQVKKLAEELFYLAQKDPSAMSKPDKTGQGQ
ncbi:MAG: 4Fe-4S dicluster domain-containing protein [Firmicutes bacterium]|nr:4Fe-4S dicluster domain-containing protein [Bacillota bacterium]